MFDYGFSYPTIKADRKASAPFVYTVATLSLIVYVGFVGYEIGFEKGLKEGKNESKKEIILQEQMELKIYFKR